MLSSGNLWKKLKWLRRLMHVLGEYAVPSSQPWSLRLSSRRDARTLQVTDCARWSFLTHTFQASAFRQLVNAERDPCRGLHDNVPNMTRFRDVHAPLSHCHWCPSNRSSKFALGSMCTSREVSGITLRGPCRMEPVTWLCVPLT